MPIKPVHTAAEYEAALVRLDVIFDAAPGTSKGDEAEVLALLIQAYEGNNSRSRRRRRLKRSASAWSSKE